MSETLYLDTARLGLISPSAQRLQIQFARLASDPHGLLYFREFLTSGSQAGLPASQQAIAAFQGWRGIPGLHDSIRYLVNAPQHSEVLLASRSATVMHVAAQQLAEQCNRVLTVDLLWPPYRRIFVEAFRRARKCFHVCQLRSAALGCDASRGWLAEAICEAFDRGGCDGLLLPLIDHHGVALPAAEIVSTLRARGCSLKQVVVDASQALGHIPIDLEAIGCDFLISGTHKWLGSYQPLGLGVSRPRMSMNTARTPPDDPLLRLSQEHRGVCRSRHGETAAVLPLLTAAGALADLSPIAVQHRLEVRRANRRSLTSILSQAGWRPARATQEYHGILLSRLPKHVLWHNHESLREDFAQHGISATFYPNGLVRFSLPHLPFSERDLVVLQAAINRISGNTRATSALKKGRLSCPMVESTIAQLAASTKLTTAKSDVTTPMAFSDVSSAT